MIEVNKCERGDVEMNEGERGDNLDGGPPAEERAEGRGEDGGCHPSGLGPEPLGGKETRRAGCVRRWQGSEDAHTREQAVEHTHTQRQVSEDTHTRTGSGPDKERYWTQTIKGSEHTQGQAVQNSMTVLVP